MSSQSTVQGPQAQSAAAPATSFYADARGLAALRKDAKADAPDALRKVAQQFESLFTQMMLKSMRAATPQDSLFGSDQQDFYRDMFDQQMAVQLSQGRGLGLADMLVRQLQKSGLAGDAAAEAIGKVTGSGAVGVDRSSGAASGSGAASSSWRVSRDEFVSRLRPAAEAAGTKLGVDADTLIAHAALETGWGRFMPVDAKGDCSFNLFGIKAGGRWDGPFVRASTVEFENGAAVPRTDAFRAYSSPEECMQDYAALLSESTRYAAALGTGSDAAAFAGALQRAGYATDPRYAEKLTAVADALKSRGGRPITAGGDTG